MGKPTQQAAIASQGLTAGQVMDYIDRTIRSAPNKAEAERRIKMIIEHSEARLGHLSWYWAHLSREDQ